MINPKWLDSMPDDIVDIWEEAEEAALVDAARMIKKYGVTATTQETMQKLRASGNSQVSINKALSGILGISESRLSKLILQAGNAVVQGDGAAYKASGIYKTTDIDKTALNTVLRQGTQDTLQNLRNIIKATAQNGSKQVYDAIDKAQLLVSSGLFSQDKAVESAIKTLADHGLDSVTYTDGKGHITQVASVETAVRRAVQTGVNQTSLKICEELADQVGCDLVEVSAHEGARPSHALWQGKVYSRSGESKKYPKLSEATGYGTITGLGGVNCRHTFGPWIDGSHNVWSDEELEELKKPTISYNGKKYTEYDASQIQRRIERTIRKWKRLKAMNEAAGLDTIEANSKIKAWESRQTDFIEQTGLRRDYTRENVYIGNNSIKMSSEQEYRAVIRGEESGFVMHRKFGNVDVSATKIDTYNTPVYVSKNAKLKPKALHKINSNIEKAITKWGVPLEYKPTIVVVSNEELIGAYGLYDAVSNTVYFAEDVANDIIASSDGWPGYTEYHEMWHLKQAHDYIQSGKEITDDNRSAYIKNLRSTKKKVIDKLGITEDNVNSISDYAAKCFMNGMYDEVEAEYMVRKIKE